VKREVRIPSLGESVTEAVIVRWLKADGERVERDEPLLELETEKASVEVPAPHAGIVRILRGAGETVRVGEVVAEIAEDAGLGAGEAEEARGEATPAPLAAQPERGEGARPAPSLRQETGEEERVPMTPIRRRIAERLVEGLRTAAILTTVNEIDMSAVLELRQRYREAFAQRHGVSLGLLSFFARACVAALKEFPALNAELCGTEIVYKRRVHLGIAVATPRGLVVPVVRNADQLSFAEIEREIDRLAARAREDKLTVQELSGGTFTITNGGVFGSLLSTPLLNPPQTGILGMHKIEKRPVVVEDRIAVRPMMYVALSYDHRLVDGEQAVRFLVRVKERIEDPRRLLLDV